MARRYFAYSPSERLKYFACLPCAKRLPKIRICRCLTLKYWFTLSATIKAYGESRFYKVIKLSKMRLQYNTASLLTSSFTYCDKDYLRRARYFYDTPRAAWATHDVALAVLHIGAFTSRSAYFLMIHIDCSFFEPFCAMARPPAL